MTLPASTLLMTGVAVVAAASAAYYRGKSTWMSVADIEAWIACQESELATLEPTQSEHVNGEIRMLVTRCSEPYDVAEPWYWYAVGVQLGEEMSIDRQVPSASGWAVSEKAAWDDCNDATVYLFGQDEDAEGAEPEDLEYS